MNEMVHWICGGGKGLGYELAKQLVNAGESVVVSTRSRTHQLANFPGTVLLGDLCDPKVVGAHIEEIHSGGRCVDRVYCATHTPMSIGQLDKLSWESYSQQFEGALRPLFNVLQAFLEADASTPNLVIAFSSSTVGDKHVRYSHRNTAKMGLEGFIKSVSTDPLLQSVRLLCLRLGYIKTEQFVEFLQGMRVECNDFGRSCDLMETADAAQKVLNIAENSGRYSSGDIIPITE